MKKKMFLSFVEVSFLVRLKYVPARQRQNIFFVCYIERTGEFFTAMYHDRVKSMLVTFSFKVCLKGMRFHADFFFNGKI